MPSTGHPCHTSGLSCLECLSYILENLSLQSPQETWLRVLTPPLVVPKAGPSPDPGWLKTSGWLGLPDCELLGVRARMKSLGGLSTFHGWLGVDWWWQGGRKGMNE